MNCQYQLARLNRKGEDGWILISMAGSLWSFLIVSDRF